MKKIHTPTAWVCARRCDRRARCCRPCQSRHRNTARQEESESIKPRPIQTINVVCLCLCIRLWLYNEMQILLH